MTKRKHLVLFLIVFVLGSIAYGGFVSSNQWNEDMPLTLDPTQLPDGPLKDEIIYGRDLIVKTPEYIGPNGSRFKLTKSAMTCGNCHLDAGTRPFGLPLFDTHGLYPQYRSREGRMLSLSERINSCLQMSMVGKPLDENSREMRAMLLYIRFLGGGRKILPRDQDRRLTSISFPEIAASPDRGEVLFQKHCASCHGQDGRGQKNEGGMAFIYPPLWGPESYRVGSSMHRVLILARFIKANMPFGVATAEKPVLSDLEALDIAAFVDSENLNSRPGAPAGKKFFPIPEFKPIDFPQGPYADPFSEDQHKYGPFADIKAFYSEKRKISRPSDGDLNTP